MIESTEAVAQQESLADALVAPLETENPEAQPGTEAGEQVEGEEQQVDSEQQTSEEDADWLPGEQEKVFPDEVLLKYAQRYQKDEQWLSDPLNRQLLIDKLNTDIFLKQQQNSVQQFEREPEPEQQQRPTQQPVPFQQWAQNASQFARQNGLINPEVSQMFAKQFMSAFGINELPKEMNPEAFTEPFVVFGMNLINSVLPLYFQAPSSQEGKNMLQHFMEQNYDGLGELAQSSAYRSAWNSVRSSFPEMAKLDYGSDQFTQLMERAEQALPGLSEMQFAGKNGQPLSPKANAERQYQIAARIASGQRLTPELMKQAVQTGKQLARQSQVRKQAGNLGAGNSKQQFSQQSDDDFWSKPESWGQYLDRKL